MISKDWQNFHNALQWNVAEILAKIFQIEWKYFSWLVTVRQWRWGWVTTSLHGSRSRTEGSQDWGGSRPSLLLEAARSRIAVSINRSVQRHSIPPPMIHLLQQRSQLLDKTLRSKLVIVRLQISPKNLFKVVEGRYLYLSFLSFQEHRCDSGKHKWTFSNYFAALRHDK